MPALQSDPASPARTSLDRIASSPLGRQALLLVAAGLNTVLFFRHTVVSGFARISGDEWDGRLMLANLEHWHHVWLLEAHWRSPIFFHPIRGALGYNDALFLYGAFYSLFRTLGADWFVSYELVNIAVKLIGFFSFFYLCHRILGVRRGHAILGASLLFQLNSTATQLGHSQLLSVSFAPLLLILIYRFVAALAGPSRARAFWFGVAAVAFYSAWAMTAFYMAWYFFLYASCVALPYLVISAPTGWRDAGIAVRRHGWGLALIVLFAALANIPLVATYSPTARETGMHDLAEVRSYTGTPIDIINVGTGNLIYGQAADRLSRLLAGEPLPGGERVTGFTPLLLLLFALGAIHCWRRPIGLDRRLVRTMLLVLVVLWLATFRIGGFLGWDYIFSYFPAGAATRVPPRFQIFVGVFVVLVATIFLDRSRWLDRPTVFLPLALLLLAEQINLSYGTGMWRHEHDWVFTSIPGPPAACRAFFILRPLPRRDVSPGNQDYYAHSVDGMMVAERFNLPTMNGAESFSPRGWDLFRWQAPDYVDRVLAFARRAGVADGLCSLDIPTRRWSIVAAR